MERRTILSTQMEVVKNSMKEGFSINGVDTAEYLGEISVETYCALVSLDYSTVARLGKVTYNIVYSREVKEEKESFLLSCETYIDFVKNDKLSVILADSEDWLGMFTKEEDEDKAQELPSNWKELLTDEDKEEIAKEWCNENSDELQDFLSDSDKADIAYDYIDDNASDCVDRAYNNLGDYDRREFIKNCIDNL